MWLQLTWIVTSALLLASCASSRTEMCSSKDTFEVLGYDYDAKESDLIHVTQHEDDKGIWGYSIVVPKSIGGRKIRSNQLFFQSARIDGLDTDMWLSLEMRSKDHDVNGFSGLEETELHGFMAVESNKFERIYFKASYGCVVVGKTVFPHNNSLNPDAGEAGAG